MYKKLLILLSFSTFALLYSQKKKDSDSLRLLKELAATSCKCVDLISAYDKDEKEISREINACITENANAYQMGTKLIAAQSTLDKKSKDDKEDINITMDFDENSDGFKRSYYALESYMMQNCTSMKTKISSSEKQNLNSVSDKQKALKMYSKGQDAYDIKDFKGAVEFYKKSLKEDPNFAFAWDNLGRTYRELNEYEKAIAAYNKSLEIDPKGVTPLQNMAIVYIYKEEYENAIKTYERLALLDDKNPEVHYGIGNIYATALQQYEKGLDHLCKAYNLYVAQKSPYRSDAEHLISVVHTEMKKAGKLKEFNKILKNNNITQMD